MVRKASSRSKTCQTPGTKPAKVKDENVIAKDLIGLLEKEVLVVDEAVDERRGANLG